MLRNYLLVFFRNIARNKTFTLLNVGGFSMGMAACILILLFISHEQSFDRFHSKSDRIYRLNEWQRFEGMQEQQVALSMYPMGPMLQKDHPEIEAITRIESRENALVRDAQKQLAKRHLLYVDSTFLQIFDFGLKSGNRQEALMSPTGITITATFAKQLFGSDEAIGKTVEIKRGDEYPAYTVTAVLEDIPVNSHLQFEMLLPMSALVKQPWMDTWETNWLNTYILLKENADPQRLAAAFPAFEKKYLAENEKLYDLVLQPFSRIHLHSTDITHDDMNRKKFSYSYIRTFLALAISVLLIAVFNFINLSTAVAVKRAKEAGIRKTIGASRWQLIRQFMGEAILFSLISFSIAIVIALVTLPLINKIFDRSIQFEFSSYKDAWGLIIAAVLGVGIISGVYPALLVSRYQPVTMVKGSAAIQSVRRFSFRHVLVVLQFSIAVFLIISTIVITKQLQFAYKKDTGFDKEKVVVVNMNATANKKYKALKQQLLANSHIADVTAYNERLGRNINQYGAQYVSKSGETRNISVSHLYVDYNYLDFFKIKLMEGRNFSPAYSDTAGRSYIVNEELVSQLEIDKAIGTPYKGSWVENMGSIVGVVKNFNFNSLHHKIAPIYISMQNWDLSEMAIRLKESNTTAALAHIENLWKTEVPDMPFSYAFLDEHMNSLYLPDKQAGMVVNIATLLAIIVACLGLFGMALYTIETRVKEIGIRKVLGASVRGIAVKISSGFVLLVLVAAIIAFPLAWLAMNKWLEDFAFRVNINWWVFGIAGLAAILVAIITVSYQAIRAAMANPVESLRTE